MLIEKMFLIFKQIANFVVIKWNVVRIWDVRIVAVILLKVTNKMWKNAQFTCYWYIIYIIFICYFVIIWHYFSLYGCFKNVIVYFFQFEPKVFIMIHIIYNILISYSYNIYTVQSVLNFTVFYITVKLDSFFFPPQYTSFQWWQSYPFSY